ncbi:MAG TPA: hypothetical protein VH062_27135 [Polyangiaceae bacterium]|jgi:hypothetical protein|nr:hypothetical protein [Polyangiaceae bacterium]
MFLVQAFTKKLDALIPRLSTARMQRVVTACALLLAATSVGPHRALDDYVLALIARGRGAAVGLTRAPLDLFTFTTGSVAGNHRLMDVGLMLPWWTDPELKIAFFRPVASLTHWVDERLWPSSAVAMHLHSLAWFGVLLFAVAALYRRLDGSPRAAGLAFFLYALDDAHGPTLAWLANRNALIAGALGAGALIAHDAWRTKRSHLGAVLAPLLLLAGLLAGELAIGAVGYLAAYALVLEGGALRRRALSFAPTAAVVVGWRLYWLSAGYGAKGSGAYVDPLGSPFAFCTELPMRLAVLLHGQFSAPPSDLAFLAPPAHRPFLVAIAIVTVAVVVWILLPYVRRDRTCRFWALGMTLSLLPLAATFPSDRLLLFVGIGASALLARPLDDFVRAGSQGTLPGGARTVLTGCLLLLHVVGAPLLLPVRAGQMEIFAVAHDRGAAGIPSDASVTGRTVVIVAAPTVLFANYVQAERELLGVPRPAHLYVLSSASSAIAVERAGESGLLLRPEHGFLYTPLDKHYRGSRPLAVGDRVELSAMTAEIVESSSDGRPRAVRYTFGTGNDAPLILTWKDGRFVPMPLPDAGHTVTLPEEDFGKILLAAALHGS